MYGQFVHAVTRRYDGHFTPRNPLARSRPSTSGRSGTSRTSARTSARRRSRDRPSRSRRRCIDPCCTRVMRPCARPNPVRKYGADRRTGRDRVRVARARRPRQVARRHLPDPCVGVPARAVLRQRPLQAAAGLDRDPIRVPGDACRGTIVPVTEPGVVRCDRVRRSPLRLAPAPNANPAKINRDYATFPVLDRVEKALDGVTGAYGSHRRLPIFNDEFGYITSPPQPAGLRYPTPQRAAPSSTRPSI